MHFFFLFSQFGIMTSMIEANDRNEPYKIPKQQQQKQFVLHNVRKCLKVQTSNANQIESIFSHFTFI